MRLEAHEEECERLGEAALLRLMELDNENSGIGTAGLKESLRSVWPEDLPLGLEKALCAMLAGVDRFAIQ